MLKVTHCAIHIISSVVSITKNLFCKNESEIYKKSSCPAVSQQPHLSTVVQHTESNSDRETAHAAFVSTSRFTFVPNWRGQQPLREVSSQWPRGAHEDIQIRKWNGGGRAFIKSSCINFIPFGSIGWDVSGRMETYASEGFVYA